MSLPPLGTAFRSILDSFATTPSQQQILNGQVAAVLSPTDIQNLTPADQLAKFQTLWAQMTTAQQNSITNSVIQSLQTQSQAQLLDIWQRFLRLNPGVNPATPNTLDNDTDTGYADQTDGDLGTAATSDTYLQAFVNYMQGVSTKNNIPT